MNAASAFPRRCSRVILGGWLDSGGGTSLVGQEGRKSPSRCSRDEQRSVPNSGWRKGGVGLRVVIYQLPLPFLEEHTQRRDKAAHVSFRGSHRITYPRPRAPRRWREAPPAGSAPPLPGGRRFRLCSAGSAHSSRSFRSWAVTWAPPLGCRSRLGPHSAFRSSSCHLAAPPLMGGASA